MTKSKILGRVKGPSDRPHYFLFISPFADRIKFGEFVYYEIDVDGRSRHVLSRVVSQEPLRLPPISYYAYPDVDPQDVGAMMGVEDLTDYNLYQVEAQVMGYHDKVMGFVNPHLLPGSTDPIFHAPAELLKEVLFKKQPRDVGSATVGSLLSRESGEVPVTLDVPALTSTHLAIIASTGAGKSYLAGVLIEELMKQNNCASVIVVDPHGEATTLEEIANQESYWEPPNRGDLYKPEVRVIAPGGFLTRIGTVEMGDLYQLLPGLSDRMKSKLYEAYNEAQRQSRQQHSGDPERWTLHSLKAILQEMQDEGDPSAGALIWRLNSVLGNPRLFHNTSHSPLEKICKPGLCSVLQLNQDAGGSRIAEGEQQLAVAALLRRIFTARRKGELESPVFILIEEAHIFAPFGGDASSKSILKTIMGEGRKFGVGVALISQRPGKLDGDVLSQANTHFLLRIQNPTDQGRVAESVEAVGRDLLAELPALTPGQAIIAGAALNTPILVRVRERDTRHGGQSANAPAEWRDNFFGTRARVKRNDGPGQEPLPSPPGSREIDPFS